MKTEYDKWYDTFKLMTLKELKEIQQILDYKFAHDLDHNGSKYSACNHVVASIS